MNETKLCDKEDDTVLFRDLHHDREIVVCGLRWEEYIDGLLREDGVRGLMIDLNNMQLSREGACQRRNLIRMMLRRYLGPSDSPDRGREEFCRGLVSIQLQLRKRGCMPFDGLTDGALDAVQQHHALTLSTVRCVTSDTDKRHPLSIALNPVVDDFIVSEEDEVCGLHCGTVVHVHPPCSRRGNSESRTQHPTIAVGIVYMSVPVVPVKGIMKDMMETLKGVQLPTRDLFSLHYLSGRTRDHLQVCDDDG